MTDTQAEKDTVAEMLGWKLSKRHLGLPAWNDSKYWSWCFPVGNRICGYNDFNPLADPHSSDLLLNGLDAKCPTMTYKRSNGKTVIRFWFEGKDPDRRYADAAAESTNPDAAAAQRECLWKCAKKLAGVAS